MGWLFENPKIDGSACTWERPYLAVFFGTEARVVALPSDGPLVMGYGPGDELLWGDAAREVVGNGGVLELELVDGQVFVRLGAGNGGGVDGSAGGEDGADVEADSGVGVTINGSPMAGNQLLMPGDGLAWGRVLAVLHGAPSQGSSTRRPSLLSMGRFLTRLGEECERSGRTGMPFAVLSIRMTGSQEGFETASIPTATPNTTGASTSSPMVRDSSLLKGLAALCRTLRKSDLICGDGSDRILVALMDTGEPAGTVARRILADFAAAGVLGRVGLALCPEHARKPEELLATARNAAEKARPGSVFPAGDGPLKVTAGPCSILVADPAMHRLLNMVRRLAVSNLTVLIEGETGVGKEVVAHALHHWSDRKDGPLVAINCAAITESLFESELFGHERGAFTGATSSKAGILESAAHGTVILDEIGECPQGTQAKLLRVIETRRVSRVGALSDRPIDVRIIAATNRELEKEVRAGRFRADLYFRLRSAHLVVPPLRSRKRDVLTMATRFLEEACVNIGRESITLQPDACQRLISYAWPGNVRELKNMMEFAAATQDGDQLGAAQLDCMDGAGGTSMLVLGEVEPAHHPAALRPGSPVDVPCNGENMLEPFEGRRFPSVGEELAHLERTRMEQALVAADGVQVKAAQLLMMPLRTFVSKRQRYGLKVQVRTQVSVDHGAANRSGGGAP